MLPEMAKNQPNPRLEAADGGGWIGGMRGVAVPENSPQKALAIEFASFLLGKAAQQASLEQVGAAGDQA